MIGFYLAGWLGLMLVGMPVAFTLGLIAFSYLLIEGGPVLSASQRMIAGLDSFPLLAVPGFILAGEIMNSGGITTRIFLFARAIVGRFPGGLGQVNVLASFFASGISGSAVADAAGLGALEHRAMKDAGYPDSFSGPLSATSAILGPLIPPSIPMVVYGVIASVSVGQLFLAGLMPGLLTTAVLMVFVWWTAKRRNFPRDARVPFRVVVRTFIDAIWALLAPFLIIFGLFAGVFTPTEAAAIAAIYALVVSMFIYKSIGLRHLPRIFMSAASTTATVGMIVACANLVNYVLTIEQVPQHTALWISSISTNPLVILLVINLALLLLGMVMDGMAILILAVPILLPVTASLGIDPVHFGVIVVMNVMIGFITPPFGMGLFVISHVTGIPYRTMMSGVLPAIPWLIFVLLVITIFPDFVMALPRFVFG